MILRRVGERFVTRIVVIAVIVGLLLASMPGLATPTALTVPTWTRLYQNIHNGSPVETSAADIYPTADGGFVAVGVTSSPSGDTVGWVLKVGASGTPEWSVELGGAFTYPSSIEQTADGGYILAGGTLTGSETVCAVVEGKWCAWVAKLGPLGNLEWQNVYTAAMSSQQVAWEIRQRADGGYAIAGNSGTTSNYGAWVAALDPQGAVEWQRVFGGTSKYDLANFESVRPTAEGGIVAAGWNTAGYDDMGINQLSAFVVKLDSGGTVLWERAYTNFDGEGTNIGGSRAESIVQASDGGYLVGGSWHNRGNTQGADFLVLKLDAGGNLQWQKAYDGGVQCFTGGTGSIICVRLGGVIYTVRSSPDGGYLLSGIGHAVEGDQVGVVAWMGKVDSNGNLLWQNTYFPAGSIAYAFYGAGTTVDGGVVAIGTTTARDTLKDQVYVVKADADGNVASCSEVHTGVPLMVIDPSLATVAPSLPISTAAAVSAPTGGDALSTSASVVENCGGGDSTASPLPPIRKGKGKKRT